MIKVLFRQIKNGEISLVPVCYTILGIYTIGAIILPSNSGAGFRDHFFDDKDD